MGPEDQGTNTLRNEYFLPNLPICHIARPRRIWKEVASDVCGALDPIILSDFPHIFYSGCCCTLYGLVLLCMIKFFLYYAFPYCVTQREMRENCPRYTLSSRTPSTMTVTATAIGTGSTGAWEHGKQLRRPIGGPHAQRGRAASGPGTCTLNRLSSRQSPKAS